MRPLQVLCLGFISYYWTKYKQNPDNDNWNSNRNCIYFSVIGLCLSLFLNTILSHPYWFLAYRIVMQIRIACCHLIYRKSLKLSDSALRQTTVGRIVNLLTNDVTRFDTLIFFLNYIFHSPIQALISTSIIYFYLGIGVPSLVGLSIIFILYLPFQSIDFLNKLFLIIYNFSPNGKSV